MRTCFNIAAAIVAFTLGLGQTANAQDDPYPWPEPWDVSAFKEVADPSVARFGYPRYCNPGMPGMVGSAIDASRYKAADLVEMAGYAIGASGHDDLWSSWRDVQRETKGLSMVGLRYDDPWSSPDLSVARTGYPRPGNPGMPPRSR